jgi:hypothetical protein
VVLREITGLQPLYNQSNLSKKYHFFKVLKCQQPCKLGLLGLGSGKPLSLLSAKFLTFLYKVTLNNLEFAKYDVVKTPHFATALG